MSEAGKQGDVTYGVDHHPAVAAVIEADVPDEVIQAVSVGVIRTSVALQWARKGTVISVADALESSSRSGMIATIAAIADAEKAAMAMTYFSQCLPMVSPEALNQMDAGEYPRTDPMIVAVHDFAARTIAHACQGLEPSRTAEISLIVSDDSTGNTPTDDDPGEIPPASGVEGDLEGIAQAAPNPAPGDAAAAADPAVDTGVADASNAPDTMGEHERDEEAHPAREEDAFPADQEAAPPAKTADSTPAPESKATVAEFHAAASDSAGSTVADRHSEVASAASTDCSLDAQRPTPQASAVDEGATNVVGVDATKGDAVEADAAPGMLGPSMSMNPSSDEQLPTERLPIEQQPQAESAETLAVNPETDRAPVSAPEQVIHVPDEIINQQALADPLKLEDRDPYSLEEARAFEAARGVPSRNDTRGVELIERPAPEGEFENEARAPQPTPAIKKPESLLARVINAVAPGRALAAAEAAKPARVVYETPETGCRVVNDGFAAQAVAASVKRQMRQGREPLPAGGVMDQVHTGKSRDA